MIKWTQILYVSTCRYLYLIFKPICKYQGLSHKNCRCTPPVTFPVPSVARRCSGARPTRCSTWSPGPAGSARAETMPGSRSTGETLYWIIVTIHVKCLTFSFMKRHEATRQFLNSKALTYDGSGASGVPDTPYECRHCGKGYKNFSSLMQHQVNRL